MGKRCAFALLALAFAITLIGFVAPSLVMADSCGVEGCPTAGVAGYTGRVLLNANGNHGASVIAGSLNGCDCVWRLTPECYYHPHAGGYNSCFSNNNFTCQPPTGGAGLTLDPPLR